MKNLNVLHLEDSPDDAFFVQRCLRITYADCTFKVVDNQDDFLGALKEFNPDLILSDHSMPRFDSTSALELCRNENMDIPFILVTGAVSEEFAVQCLQRGADDYILKSSLDRLPNAVKRALDKKKTERQRDELVRKLEASLKEKDDLLAEKDALIQEVHHRVKNNLSIITSLLNIQAGFVSDRKVKALLIESVSRIRSMGMVHEMIYDQTNFSNVVMETYIIKLFQFISINFADPDVSVRYDIDARDVFLNINVAMPCALILNELITNAYKHAFRGRRDGEIKVSLSKKDNNRYDLKVSDNGVGLPEEADDSTLGLSLVHGLVNQIQGTVSIERNGAGTTYVITFAGAG